MENNEKTYSQAQVDDIANSVRNTEQKKYSDLETRFNDLQAQNTKLNEMYDNVLKTQDKLVYDANKSTFINHGGNPNSFDDFYQLNKANFDSINWDETAKMKPHFFMNQSPEIDSSFFDKKTSNDDIEIDFGKERADMLEQINKQTYRS